MFAYGWPKALNTGATPLDHEAIYCCQTSGEYVIAVFTATVQVWSSGQHRLKLGELHRTREQVEEEGANVRAHWCPQKRVLAVATARNHLQLYALNVSSEALWRLPSGQDVRRLNVYLSHSLHLDYGPVSIADLGGDAKSLLVALSNGTMQVFSWQGKLRGQANPFIAAYEGSRSRVQRQRQGSLPSAGSLSGGANGLLSPAAYAAVAGGTGSRQGSSLLSPEASSALLAAMAAMDLPSPTPAQPAEVAVAGIHYAPGARMLAVVLRDGRCALCRTADSGIHPIEQLQLFRWVYKPAGPGAPAAVAAALNPTGQLLALGLSHGRVAIYTMQSLLSLRHHHRRGSSGRMNSAGSSAGISGSGGGSTDPAAASSGGGGGGVGQPEPARLLSLADWGYRSAVVGPAAVLQWSPDGRVLAVGYGERGMAVWTPSGCRLMCSLRQAVATSAGAGSSALSPKSATLAGAAPSRPPPPAAAAQQDALPRSSVDGLGGHAGSPRRAVAAASMWSQNSCLNPSQAPEPGVLEGAISALAWSAHGYQLLVAESGQAGCLHQLEFARQMHGAHRVVVPQAGACSSGSGGGSGDEVQALQAADRILLICETRQAVNPALRMPAATSSEQGEAEAAAGARPDLALQHVKLPQQYIEAAYPLLHSAISQDGADVAVAGTRGLAVYSRRARRWRLFGDATQERSLRVESLVWLPGGIIAACAHVDTKEAAGAPQLLLYPQYHLDNASLLARMPLKQVPVAMDSVGWHLALAFAPLAIKLFKVTVEGPLGPAGRPTARLTAVRELSIMGLGNPLQEIALIDPYSLPQAAAAGSGSRQSGQLPQGLDAAAAAAAAATPDSAADPNWPKLTVATKPRAAGATGADGSGAAGGTAEGGSGSDGGEAPMHCVLLRAGGIMSKLDLQEGSEVLLSDAIERFWLPISPETAAAGARPGGAAALGSTSATPSLSRSSSSTAPLGQHASEADLQLPSAAGSAARLAQQQLQLDADGVRQVPRQPPRVELPWWTYGARGMQLWFPSSLSEPLTPSMRNLTSPTATGLAAAAAAASTNSTDPELEFDREVYPIGVSLAGVSIIGVMQRTVRSNAFPPEAAQSLCLHPLPESQPVLPCLLRRLLQKGRQDDALELARWHSGGPHFNRSLEWLLFTALEFNAEQPHAAALPASSSSSGNSGAGPLLVAAAKLISQFPQSPEIVVSVARKTDAALWPALFAAVGSPGQLCQGLMQADKLQSAACCLVIVEQIEGSSQARLQAVQLIQAALEVAQYSLAGDLLRFLVPPGDGEAQAHVEPGTAAGSAMAAAAAEQSAAATEQSRAAAALQAEQQQQAAGAAAQQQQAANGGSWFWGLFGAGDTAAPPAAAPALGAQQQQAAARAAAAAAAQRQQSESEEDADADGGAAAGEAWRLTARHAWKLLDSGALREAALLARSLAELRGGLAALLAATAGAVPAAGAHLAPSGAAIASALFVAANEFASTEQEAEAAEAAELLMAVCQEAGCVNLATALALLLGDQQALQAFAADHPAVWSELYGFIANDVHLCGYAPVLSPLHSPAVGGGGFGGGGGGLLQVA